MDKKLKKKIVAEAYKAARVANNVGRDVVAAAAKCVDDMLLTEAFSAEREELMAQVINNVAAGKFEEDTIDINLSPREATALVRVLRIGGSRMTSELDDTFTDEDFDDIYGLIGHLEKQLSENGEAP